MMRIYSQVNEIQAMRAEANAHLLAQGMSDEAAFKEVQNLNEIEKDLKQLQTLAEEAKEALSKVDNHHQTVEQAKKATSSSAKPVDSHTAALYETVMTGAPSLADVVPASAALKTPSAAHKALTLITQVSDRIEAFAHKHPQLKSVATQALSYAQNIATAYMYCEAMAVGGALGAAAGAPFAGIGAVPGSVGGAIIGLTAAMSAEKALAHTVDAGLTYGLEQVQAFAAKTAHNQIESERFQKGVASVTDTLLAGLALRGVKKVVQPRVVVERPHESHLYTSAFQATLERGTHFPGKTDRLHFQEANRQLHQKMLSDSSFKSQLETLYPGIGQFVSPSKSGTYPSAPPVILGLTWHHNSYHAGVMDLIPRDHHRAPGPVQKNLHPQPTGGM
jgi:hypothetical protein